MVVAREVQPQQWDLEEACLLGRGRLSNQVEDPALAQAQVNLEGLQVPLEGCPAKSRAANIAVDLETMNPLFGRTEFLLKGEPSTQASWLDTE